jgi:hypothetical protein
MTAYGPPVITYLCSVCVNVRWLLILAKAAYISFFTSRYRRRRRVLIILSLTCMWKSLVVVRGWTTRWQWESYLCFSWQPRPASQEFCIVVSVRILWNCDIIYKFGSMKSYLYKLYLNIGTVYFEGSAHILQFRSLKMWCAAHKYIGTLKLYMGQKWNV